MDNKKGRPIKYINGAKEHYKQNKEYFINYYQNNKQKFKCPFCCRNTNLFTLNQHLKGLFCKLIQEQKPDINIDEYILKMKLEQIQNLNNDDSN